MEIKQFCLLKMVSAAFSLLLLMHLQRIFASGFVIQSNYCDSVHLAYSNSYGDESFYINGNLVDKVLFCKDIQFHSANGCIFKHDSWEDYCALIRNLSPVELRLKAGRKILLDDGKGEEGKQIHPGELRNVHKSMSIPKKVGFAAAGFFFLCCAFLCPCFYKRRKPPPHTALTKDQNSMDSTSPFEIDAASDKITASPFRVPSSPLRVPPSPKFSLSPKVSKIGSVHLSIGQVTRATRNFSPSLRIGEGGFGTVYKARLEDGRVVAVKCTKKEHVESSQTEFSSEVELLAKIDHRNLVKLLGFIDKGRDRFIITEYVPNGTLREHLDGLREKILDFNQRLEIAIDVAHGLAYLHLYAEKQIIHRDVKSSNILLTENMRAKVADFGFARLGPMDMDANQTHISTIVKGTVGYLDPEYMRTFQLTPKSDVYSFGILLLEILTGCRPVESKRPFEERVTLRWAFSKYNEGFILDLVDPLMEEVVDVKIIKKMFNLAFHCAAPIRNDRPDMKTVGEQLWMIRADYVKSVQKRTMITSPQN